VEFIKVVLLTVLLGGAAHAQRDGEVLFNTGRKAFREQRYEAAADAFEAAFRLDHLPGLLFNEAVALRRLYDTAPRPDRLARAIAVCRRYLDEFPNGPERESVKEELEVLSKLVDPPSPKLEPPKPEPPKPEPTHPEPPNPDPPAPVDEQQPFASGAGKYAVRVESSGAEQQVSAQHNLRFLSLCTTPCRLFTRPGPLTLRLDGEGIVTTTAMVDVPEGGWAVRVRAPSKARRQAAFVLLGVGGAATAIGFSSLIAGGVISLTGSGTNAFFVGGAFLPIGIAGLIAGVVLVRQSSAGIEWQGPLPVGAAF
jgi:hypothetical protein